jgi:ketosteroid isomerase-like protein
MAEIVVSADCGNSPKRILLKDLNIAFVTGDLDFVAGVVTDDITWTMVGDDSVQGKQPFLETVRGMNGADVAKLTIHSVITHGREGAANGTLELKNGKQYEFCDVFQFRGAKGTRIKSIRSYVIEIDT